MKQYIKLSIACAFALILGTACNQDLLNIPQKGVIAYEDFYKTDEDALSALMAVYSKGCEIDAGGNGQNQPSWNVLAKGPGDEMYWGGNGKSDSQPAQEIGELRGTFSNNNTHLRTVYRWIYALIYRCNLLIDNFWGENGELADTPIKKQCVAEARAMRAWAHFQAAIYFYNPPLVDHVLPGDARPGNTDHLALLDFVISEYNAVYPQLPERKGPSDKEGAVRLTRGAVQAFLGQALVFRASEKNSAEDWNAAKTALKQVITSGNYDLVPTSQLDKLFHRAGDGCCEKVFEFNIVDNENISQYNARYHYQRNQALMYRQMKLPFPTKCIQQVGWGNNVSPTEKFVAAMLEHEPDSPRRKAWFLSYEEFITEQEFPTDTKADGSKMTKEEKLMDGGRGLELKKYNDLYANCGYFWVKFMPYRSDLINNHTSLTDENRLIMRYAEVLLLYAEACAMTNDNDGLQYLQKIQTRAGAPVSDVLNMDEVKREKWFELAWEGQRWKDLVRWGDAAKELAYKCHTDTPYLTDDFYEYGTLGKKTTGRPHKSVLIYKDDGWGAKGGGWKSNHNEYYPIPFSELEINDVLQQNPYWDKGPTQAHY